MAIKKQKMDGYITLEEAEEISSCQKSLLESLIKKGKLKSFKMGAEWFTTKEWLADCKARIKSDLEEEMRKEFEADEEIEEKWVECRKIRLPFLRTKLSLVPQAMAWVILFLFVGLNMAIFDAPKSVDHFIIETGKVVDKGYQANYNFLVLSHRVFSYPARVVSNTDILMALDNFSVKRLQISDEEITKKWHQTLDESEKFQELSRRWQNFVGREDAGQVAGASE